MSKLTRTMKDPKDHINIELIINYPTQLRAHNFKTSSKHLLQRIFNNNDTDSNYVWRCQSCHDSNAYLKPYNGNNLINNQNNNQEIQQIHDHVIMVFNKANNDFESRIFLNEITSIQDNKKSDYLLNESFIYDTDNNSIENIEEIITIKDKEVDYNIKNHIIGEASIKNILSNSNLLDSIISNENEHYNVNAIDNIGGRVISKLLEPRSAIIENSNMISIDTVQLVEIKNISSIDNDDSNNITSIIYEDVILQNDHIIIDKEVNKANRLYYDITTIDSLVSTYTIDNSSSMGCIYNNINRIDDVYVRESDQVILYEKNDFVHDMNTLASKDITNKIEFVMSNNEYHSSTIGNNGLCKDIAIDLIDTMYSNTDFKVNVTTVDMADTIYSNTDFEVNVTAVDIIDTMCSNTDFEFNVTSVDMVDTIYGNTDFEFNVTTVDTMYNNTDFEVNVTTIDMVDVIYNNTDFEMSAIEADMYYSKGFEVNMTIVHSLDIVVIEEDVVEPILGIVVDGSDIGTSNNNEATEQVLDNTDIIMQADTSTLIDKEIVVDKVLTINEIEYEALSYSYSINNISIGILIDNRSIDLEVEEQFLDTLALTNIVVDEYHSDLIVDDITIDTQEVAEHSLSVLDNTTCLFDNSITSPNPVEILELLLEDVTHTNNTLIITTIEKEDGLINEVLITNDTCTNLEVEENLLDSLDDTSYISFEVKEHLLVLIDDHNDFYNTYDTYISNIESNEGVLIDSVLLINTTALNSEVVEEVLSTDIKDTTQSFAIEVEIFDDIVDDVNIYTIDIIDKLESEQSLYSNYDDALTTTIDNEVEILDRADNTISYRKEEEVLSDNNGLFISTALSIDNEAEKESSNVMDESVYMETTSIAVVIEIILTNNNTLIDSISKLVKGDTDKIDNTTISSHPITSIEVIDNLEDQLLINDIIDISHASTLINIKIKEKMSNAITSSINNVEDMIDDIVIFTSTTDNVEKELLTDNAHIITTCINSEATSIKNVVLDMEVIGCTIDGISIEDEADNEVLTKIDNTSSTNNKVGNELLSDSDELIAVISVDSEVVMDKSLLTNDALEIEVTGTSASSILNEDVKNEIDISTNNDKNELNSTSNEDVISVIPTSINLPEDIIKISLIKPIIPSNIIDKSIISNRRIYDPTLYRNAWINHTTTTTATRNNVYSTEETTSSSSYDIAYSSNIDITYYAFSFLIVGIAVIYLVAALYRYMKKWNNLHNIPRYLSELEKQVIELLNKKEYLVVKNILEQQLTIIQRFKGNLHVDTAAFKHFLAKALLGLDTKLMIAETYLNDVMDIYNNYGEDVYMAHVLEDLALVQQQQYNQSIMEAIAYNTNTNYNNIDNNNNMKKADSNIDDINPQSILMKALKNMKRSLRIFKEEAILMLKTKKTNQNNNSSIYKEKHVNKDLNHSMIFVPIKSNYNPYTPYLDDNINDNDVFCLELSSPCEISILSSCSSLNSPINHTVMNMSTTKNTYNNCNNININQDYKQLNEELDVEQQLPLELNTYIFYKNDLEVLNDNSISVQRVYDQDEFFEQEIINDTLDTYSIYSSNNSNPLLAPQQLVNNTNNTINDNNPSNTSKTNLVFSKNSYQSPPILSNNITNTAYTTSIEKVDGGGCYTQCCYSNEYPISTIYHENDSVIYNHLDKSLLLHSNNHHSTSIYQHNEKDMNNKYMTETTDTSIQSLTMIFDQYATIKNIPEHSKALEDLERMLLEPSKQDLSYLCTSLLHNNTTINDTNINYMYGDSSILLKEKSLFEHINNTYALHSTFYSEYGVNNCGSSSSFLNGIPNLLLDYPIDIHVARLHIRVAIILNILKKYNESLINYQIGLYLNQEIYGKNSIQVDELIKDIIILQQSMEEYKVFNDHYTMNSNDTFDYSIDFRMNNSKIKKEILTLTTTSSKSNDKLVESPNTVTCNSF